MGRTVGLRWPWWDMGILRTSHGPLGTLGWEGQWDWGGLDGTWESQGLPMVPLGLRDVLTGLRDCDCKLGHHSEKETGKRYRGENKKKRVWSREGQRKGSLTRYPQTPNTI